MAVHDKVMIVDSTGIHVSHNANNVTVYDLVKDANGNFILDGSGVATPIAVGGVKVGVSGKIVGNPVSVAKSKILKLESTAHYAHEYIKLFPVNFDYYQKTAYVSEENVKIVSFE